MTASAFFTFVLIGFGGCLGMLVAFCYTEPFLKEIKWAARVVMALVVDVCWLLWAFHWHMPEYAALYLTLASLTTSALIYGCLKMSNRGKINGIVQLVHEWDSSTGRTVGFTILAVLILLGKAL